MDEQKSGKRFRDIQSICETLNKMGIDLLFKKEGITGLDFDRNVYLAGEQHEQGSTSMDYLEGISSHLKYLAARRIMLNQGVRNIPIAIVMKGWSQEIMKRYRSEFQKVRIGWFWSCIQAARENYVYFAEILDRIVK